MLKKSIKFIDNKRSNEIIKIYTHYFWIFKLGGFMLKKLIVPFICIFSLNAYADDISGAFGLKFNDKIEKANKSLDRYKVKPEKKFELFDEYFVALTPKTKKIYSITGSGEVSSGCREDMNLIKTLLEDKYPDFESIKIFTQDMATNPYRAVTFTKDKVKVILSCSEESKRIAITYINFEIEKESEDERVELMQESIKSKQKRINVESL